MKYFRSVLLFIIVFGISSCQKAIVFVDGSGPDGDPPGTITSSMSAKVDGVLVECNLTTSQLWMDNGKQNMQLNGSKTPQSFVFTWQDFKGVGVYNAADIISSADYIAGITDLHDAYFAESGSINITTYNEQVIIGTFAFKATNSNGETKNITEGKFTIKLEAVLGPTPGTGDKSMSATIDGIPNSFAGEGLITNTPGLGKIVTVIGLNGAKNLSVIITNYKGLGTYDMAKAEAQGDYSEDQSQSGSYTSTTGTVTIQSFTATKIKGTFEFEAPNENVNFTTKRSITNGTFEVAYKSF